MLALVLTVRFALELVLLATFGWWGWTLGGWLLGIVFVLAVAVVWGLLLSPKARVRLSPATRNGVELVVFVVAAAALASRGHLLWGTLLLMADVLVLIALWRLHATTDGTPA